MKNLLLLLSVVITAIISSCSPKQEAADNNMAKLGEIFKQMNEKKLGYEEGIAQIDALLDNMSSTLKDNPYDFLNIQETKLNLIYNMPNSPAKDAALKKIEEKFNSLGESFKKIESYWLQKAQLHFLQGKEGLELLQIYVDCIKEIPSHDQCRAQYQETANGYSRPRCVEMKDELYFKLASTKQEGEFKTSQKVDEKETIYLSDKKLFTGSQIKEMYPVQGTTETGGKARIELKFDGETLALLGKTTKENIGKRLALFYNNDLVMAPTIQSEIGGDLLMVTPPDNLKAQDIYNNICKKQGRPVVPENLRI